jgi:hypothetical protein
VCSIQTACRGGKCAMLFVAATSHSALIYCTNAHPQAHTQVTSFHLHSEAPRQQCTMSSTIAHEHHNITSLLIGSLAYTLIYCNPSSTLSKTHLQGRHVHCAISVSATTAHEPERRDI